MQVFIHKHMFESVAELVQNCHTHAFIHVNAAKRAIGLPHCVSCGIYKVCLIRLSLHVRTVRRFLREKLFKGQCKFIR